MFVTPFELFLLVYSMCYHKLSLFKHYAINFLYNEVNTEAQFHTAA